MAALIMKMRLVLASLALGCLVFPGAAHGEDALASVIANVRANEKLYDDIDISYERNYETRMPRGTLPDAALQTQRVRFRSVTQGTWLRFRRDEMSCTVAGDQRDYWRMSAYDGDKTRRVENGKVANIHLGRVDDSQLMRPHTWLLSRAKLSFPLSVFLQGGDALRNHGMAGDFANSFQVSALEGSEIVDGLACVKLRCETRKTIQNEERVITRRFIWLAIARNYIPIKSVGYVPFYSSDLPIEEGRASEWKEVAPAVWLPHRYKLTVYDERTLKEQKKAVVGNTEEGVVKEVKLDPKHPVEFFRDVPVTGGAVVYEVANGQIVSGSFAPKASEAAAVTSVGRSWLWILLASVFVVGFALLSYRYLVRKTSR